MSCKGSRLFRFGRQAVENGLRFLFSVVFIFVYQQVFGAENTLPGVAVSVALTMYPTMDLGVRPLTMAGTIAGLFVAAGLVAQLALASPWLALPCNLLFVLLIMLLTCEPEPFKPSVCFLLAFVFSQATPVPMERFPLRMAGLAAGGLLVAGVTLLEWHRRGFGRQGRSLTQQMRLSLEKPGLIVRMALGLSLAMFAGMVLHLRKPLWISIVVMSLTQLEFHETVARIKHRAAATILGIVIFVLLFRIALPEEYAILAVMLFGYVGYFLPAYKYKQVINAISALQASLVLLDTTEAVGGRVLCLLGGIAIVLILFFLQHLYRLLRSRLHSPAAPQQA